VHTPDPDAAVLGRPDSPDLRAQVQADLEAKATRVAELMGRPVDARHASPRASGYRARISLRTDRDGRLGFTRPRSHDFLPADHAPLAREAVNTVLGGLPPLPGLGGVELRTDDERVVLAAWSPRKGKGARNRRNRGASAETKARLQALVGAVPGLDGVSLDGRGIAGQTVLHPTVAGIRLHVGPASFFQVNLEVNEALVGAVVAAVSEAAPTAIADLYSGVGNLSLPMAAATGARMTLVESHPQATADARKAARAHGIEVDARAADADRFQAGDAFFDVAVLDPPRAGAKGVLSQLAVTRPRRIVYVSCHAPALARDVREATAAGYRVEHLAVFDMFPQTPHVETLCVLTR
jgi:23S rRNA (uracil1939-C5)-methyltransferase